MKKLVASVLLTFMLVLVVHGGGKYENELFLINPLLDDNNISNTQPLIMMLPASDGFSPNINIQIQAYPGSIDEYDTLSIKQIEQLKLKTIKHLKEGDVLTFEYTGAMRGRDFHWFGMAYKKGDNVFLITATATEKQWPDVGAKLIECVKSFKLK